jgi:hypothetical protein
VVLGTVCKEKKKTPAKIYGWRQKRKKFMKMGEYA